MRVRKYGTVPPASTSFLPARGVKPVVRERDSFDGKYSISVSLSRISSTLKKERGSLLGAGRLRDETPGQASTPGRFC